MAQLWGQEYSKSDILQSIGEITQIAGTKSYELKDGKAYGVRAIDVKTGSGLEFTILPDRGMDIAWASYKGKSLCILTKNGIVSSKYYEAEGNNWFRSFFGGLLTTCGLSNTGAYCEDNGEKYGLHGRISNTPAEKINIDECWEGDEYSISISGNMRESTFYGENLQLRRQISTSLGSKSLVIHDIIENNGFSAVPLLVLYHYNIGFPLLDENSHLIINQTGTEFYDESSKEGADSFTTFQKPTHEYYRQVFFHKMKQDKDGNTACALVNPNLDGGSLGIFLKYNRKQLPEFFEFKMMGQSDYQLGLEPSNCMPMGRKFERERNGLKYIQAGERMEFIMEIGILDGQKDIEEMETLIRSYSLF